MKKNKFLRVEEWGKPPFFHSCLLPQPSGNSVETEATGVVMMITAVAKQAPKTLKEGNHTLWPEVLWSHKHDTNSHYIFSLSVLPMFGTRHRHNCRNCVLDQGNLGPWFLASFQEEGLRGFWNLGGGNQRDKGTQERDPIKAVYELLGSILSWTCKIWP